MPDISMCAGTGCPSRNQCYRFRAKPSEHQAFTAFHIGRKGDKCEWFMDLPRVRPTTCPVTDRQEEGE